MYKAVMFDFDGMLVNSPYFSLQYEKDFSVSTDNWGDFFSGPFSKCKIGKADLKQEIEPYLSQIKWDKSVDELLDYWFKVGDIDERLVELIKLLKQKGAYVCLVTDNEKYRLSYIKENMNMSQLFDKIYASCEIGYQKKDIEMHEYIYNDILKKYSKLNKKEIMFWDDDEKKVAVASQFGFDARVYEGYEEFVEQIKNSGLIWQVK